MRCYIVSVLNIESTNVTTFDIRTSRAYALPFSVNFYERDTPPARTTRELPASAIFSTKFTELMYKKGFKNCPLRKTFVLSTDHQVNRG